MLGGEEANRVQDFYGKLNIFLPTQFSSEEHPPHPACLENLEENDPPTIQKTVVLRNSCLKKSDFVYNPILAVIEIRRKI